MKARLAGLVLLLALHSAAAEVAAADDGFGADATLRDTGYMLGDLLDERVTLKLPAGWRIDKGSLPLPGRVAPWLEVRSATLDSRDASDAPAFTVTYQVFAVSDQAARVPLPAFPLRVRNGADVRTVDVPERSFLLSPGLPSTLTDRDRELRPSPAPMPLPAADTILSVLACLAVALAAGAFLLWRYDLLPFMPRASGPLARTWRRWRRERNELSTERHALLLREVHAALSRSAGETLYPSTLGRLFERAPYLAPLRERIESVFDASWKSFYRQDESAPPATPGVLALLREAADRERGVPC